MQVVVVADRLARMLAGPAALEVVETAQTVPLQGAQEPSIPVEVVAAAEPSPEPMEMVAMAVLGL